MDSTIAGKKINFGKIDFYRTGRKINAVDVEIRLTQRGGEPTFILKDGKKEYTGNKTPEYIELAICGNVWNSKETDIVCGGQCLDTIAEYIKTPLFNRILEIWKRYHLNGLRAGTPEQEAAIKEWCAAGNTYDYTKACDYLKSIGLYETAFYGKTSGKQYNGELYKYGHGWIIEDLPEDIVKEVKEICS